MKWFIKCIKNYANFTGRARRSEYWYFILFEIIFLVAAMVVDRVLFGVSSSWFYGLTALFFFLPQLAVSVRRLHDTGRSGTLMLLYYLVAAVWCVALVVAGVASLATLASGTAGMSLGFLLLLLGGGLVFLVWGIFFLVWFCTKGTDGDNKYGSDPMLVEE